MSKVTEFTVTVSMQPSLRFNKAVVETTATVIMEPEDDYITELKRMTNEIAKQVGPKAQSLVVWLAEQADNQGRGA